MTKNTHGLPFSPHLHLPRSSSKLPNDCTSPFQPLTLATTRPNHSCVPHAWLACKTKRDNFSCMHSPTLKDCLHQQSPSSILAHVRPRMRQSEEALHKLQSKMPKQIHEIKDFLLTARRKDARSIKDQEG